MHERVTLAVLAGGESRRMGTSKPMLRLNGKPILVNLLQRLAWQGPTILVTAPGHQNPEGHELFDVQAVDPLAGQGPLRGVLTALEHSTTPLVVVIPVDMPNLMAEPLLLLAHFLQEHPEKSLAMFQQSDRFAQPLPAAFTVRHALNIVCDRLASGQHALRDLPDVLPTTLVAIPEGWPKSLWVNLNRPEDVEEYLAQIPTGATV